MDETVKQNNKIINTEQVSNEQFKEAFALAVKKGINVAFFKGKEIISTTQKPLDNSDYAVFFKRRFNGEDYYNTDPIVSKPVKTQYNMECSLVDSICARYNITREELLEIRKQKTIINKRKKEINNIFNECLEMINKKYNEERMAELVAKKLMEKQNQNNSFPVPTVPTLPITTEYEDIPAAPVYESGL